jgi:hypothetical protein
VTRAFSGQLVSGQRKPASAEKLIAEKLFIGIGLLEVYIIYVIGS